MPFTLTLPNLRNTRKVVTTAGTPVQLSATSVRCKLVTLMGMEGNTDKVVVGGAGVVAGTTQDGANTRTGIPIGSGQSISILAEDLSDVWIDSVVSGEGVTVLYQF